MPLRPFPAALMLWSADLALAEMHQTPPDTTTGGTLAPEQVMTGFGCESRNLSPAPAWEGAPQATASFIVSATDPNAPTRSGLWHRSGVNLPAAAVSLPEGASPPGGTAMSEGGIQARNDLSQNATADACPPAGVPPHWCAGNVFAIPEATLPFDETASAALVGFFVNARALGRATLTTSFGRTQ